MIDKIINEFFERFGDFQSDIYNEFSLQHELGIYLREKLEGYKIQFERNVSFFDKTAAQEFIKKEIDIVIYKPDFSEKYAIELKFPKNGQYPETMFSFIKDICFMEQVKRNLKFTYTFTVVLVTDKNFYEGSYPSEIYKYFRGENRNIITNLIRKPTGKKDEVINISGTYSIDWKTIGLNTKYYLVKI